MKVLITGINGLVGQHLSELLLENEYAVAGVGRGPQRYFPKNIQNFSYYDADITNQQTMADVFSTELPGVVVHAAAITQIDQCEVERAVCEDINVKGTANLLMIAEEISAHFIFLSTDFVFDGEMGDYSEEDHQNPLSWYGFTKVQAESLVEISELDWCIVRTCLVYGSTLDGTRSNIVTWVKKSLEEMKPIKVVTDQHRTPTYVKDLAMGIFLIISKRAVGVYHISGAEKLTPWQMAIRTADLFRLDRSLITPVDASVFSQPARRPPKTGFNISKAMEELSYQPRGFEEGLQDMFSIAYQ
ncbi:MAG: NAD(P)-dependent oxidoreductase [Gemmatimonadaceae bacterium]|nr:NAD(P)-dependent oxidoreductase [Chitinophagaceae bacterium]